MGRLFGTDGVRGVANTPELDSQLAYQLGRAGAFVLAEYSHERPKIFVGKDTRISGDMLECALIAGICSTGATAVRLGVVPTPAVSYLTRKHGADAGVVISASHNPVEFNGIKFFNRDGYKLSDELEEEIEAIILDKAKEVPYPTASLVGKYEFLNDAAKQYVDFAVSTVDYRLDGFKIALDCANGAACETAPAAFESLGAEVFLIGNKPDGSNINKDCGSTHILGLQKFVVDNKCDLGLAFDGDADRMLAVDHEGNFVDGDQIMAICALDLKNKGKLKDNTLVATVMSNMGLFIFGKENGINIKQAKVGDRYVLEEMIEYGHCLGGEQSGHIIFLDHNTTGDGLISALQILDVVVKSKKSLKQLTEIITILPQSLVNAKVNNKYKNSYMDDCEIAAEIDAIEKHFSGKGRVLIRPSGTEPLVRVMIEGSNNDEIFKEAKRLATLIEKKLG